MDISVELLQSITFKGEEVLSQKNSGDNMRKVTSSVDKNSARLQTDSGKKDSSKKGDGK